MSSINFCVVDFHNFFRSKKLFFFFKERFFNINYLYKVYPKVDQMRVTIMFLLIFLLIKRSYVIFDLCHFLVHADKNATFSLWTDLRLMQFSYTKIGSFCDDSISLNKIHNFDTPRLTTLMTILCASFPMSL